MGKVWPLFPHLVDSKFHTHRNLISRLAAEFVGRALNSASITCWLAECKKMNGRVGRDCGESCNASTGIAVFLPSKRCRARLLCLLSFAACVYGKRFADAGRRSIQPPVG